MKENKLCVLRKEERSLHIYINTDNFTNSNCEICTSYDEESLAYSFDLKRCKIEDVRKILDELMSLISRDTQNWFTKNIVLHWGDNVWKFYNDKNIEEVKKDEYVKNLEDIEYFYDVEWK